MSQKWPVVTPCAADGGPGACLTPPSSRNSASGDPGSTYLSKARTLLSPIPDLGTDEVDALESWSARSTPEVSESALLAALPSPFTACVICGSRTQRLEGHTLVSEQDNAAAPSFAIALASGPCGQCGYEVCSSCCSSFSIDPELARRIAACIPENRYTLLPQCSSSEFLDCVTVELVLDSTMTCAVHAVMTFEDPQSGEPVAAVEV